jgi:hypothetical protein
LEHIVKQRLKELNAELAELVEEIKSHKGQHHQPTIELLEKIDNLTKQVLTKKSAIAELKALLEYR